MYIILPRYLKSSAVFIVSSVEIKGGRAVNTGMGYFSLTLSGFSKRANDELEISLLDNRMHKIKTYDEQNSLLYC